MITQRLCKDKIYHTMNSKVEDCAKDISSYITIFESNSTTLKNNVKDDFIIGKINKVDKAKAITEKIIVRKRKDC